MIFWFSIIDLLGLKIIKKGNKISYIKKRIRTTSTWHFYIKNSNLIYFSKTDNYKSFQKQGLKWWIWWSQVFKNQKWLDLRCCIKIKIKKAHLFYKNSLMAKFVLKSFGNPRQNGKSSIFFVWNNWKWYTGNYALFFTTRWGIFNDSQQEIIKFDVSYLLT